MLHAFRIAIARVLLTLPGPREIRHRTLSPALADAPPPQ
jgi:hypothetical protein